MKVAIVLIATVAVVSAGVQRVGWTTPPPPTPGWPAPTTTPGWGPSPGWPASNINVDLVADLGAAGIGWAAQNHADAVNVHGDIHNPAVLVSNMGGEAVLDQLGNIGQLALVNPEGATSLNNVAVSQEAIADEGATISATGNDILVGQSGWIGTSGEGALGAAAESDMSIS